MKESSVIDKPNTDVYSQDIRPCPRVTLSAQGPTGSTADSAYYGQEQKFVADGKRFTAEVKALYFLPPGWDSYDALPIDHRAITEALEATHYLVNYPKLSLPLVVPTKAGGVQLEWHTTEIDLEIAIDPVGTCEVSVEHYASGDCVEWTDTRPSALFKLVKFLNTHSVV